MLRIPLAALMLLGASFALPIPAGTEPARPLRIGRQLAGQLSALRLEKAARTQTERKIGSRLLREVRRQRGVLHRDLHALRRGVRVDAAGLTLVDILADEPLAVADAIVLQGGVVERVVERARAIRARVPIGAVQLLAELASVERIRPAHRPEVRKQDTSEGDVAHRADQARATFGLDGSGVSIGVMSDGVDSLPSVQGTGDLPGVTVLPGLAGSGSEGTAMLEIVYDLAPGASLLFATAFGGEASFADNIRALRDAGADVIVDDVGYFAEGVFQDDGIAAAVDDVAADGVLYFSAAGNGGNLTSGESGVWEGDFIDSGTTVGGSPAHDFGAGVIAIEIIEDSPFHFTLHWSDPLGGSANDYDLLLVDASVTTVFDVSDDIQNGNDDPFELITSQGFDDTGNKLMVVRSPAAALRTVHLNTNRGRLAGGTAGSTGGHAAARGALGVAAVDVAQAGAGGVFDGTEPVESFSSDGPRRVHYEADGTPITPGDLSTSGGELRAKPDIAAANCVSTATPGFATFCGTSAAAPHAAAIAALLLERGASPALAEELLRATALDIEAAGPDRDVGDGLIDALAATQAIDLPECLDGIDNDGDGATDFPDDIGCRNAFFQDESPQCSDGIDNDGDGLIDFDGGSSQNGGVPLAFADGTCQGDASASREERSSCGLGAELVLALLPLLWLRRRAG